MNKSERFGDDMNYILECAELVGVEITEKTPINCTLIAEIMRRLRESTDERN